jgi:hypothetical protein
MLQTNLIFGIQEQIKAGAKARKEHKGMIEESTSLSESKQPTECILEASFIAEMYEKSSQASKKETFKKSLVMESFDMRKAKKKLEKDIVYFNYLYENFVDEVFSDQYKELLESIFDDTIKLYNECDVTPRLVSQALDTNELNESQIIDIYKNRLNTAIKNDYTKPMISGKITSIYESQLREVTKKLIEEGSTIDAEQVKIYLPFEETMYKFNKEILVPEIATSRIDAFMESVTEEYLEFIEESAADILQDLEKKIKLLTAMISPNVFDKAVDADGIDAPKMAGITITTDSNFVEPEQAEICPAEVAEDPEAAEEMADEEEALDLESESGDVVGAEDQAREDMDLAVDAEDYEDIPARDEEAEESAAEESAEEDQIGAIDVETNDEVSSGADEDNINTNGSDKGLSGEGNDNGEDPAVGAQLPGGAEALGEEMPADDLDVEPTDEEVSDEPVLDSPEVDSDSDESQDEVVSGDGDNDEDDIDNEIVDPESEAKEEDEDEDDK